MTTILLDDLYEVGSSDIITHLTAKTGILKNSYFKEAILSRLLS